MCLPRLPALTLEVIRLNSTVVAIMGTMGYWVDL